MTKALVARMPAPLGEMLKAEVDAQGILFGTSDFAEGQAAFMGKRPPVFTGS
jgi:enoyl-CoA hydratase/carnithine racemase